jgi:DNA polymerase-3 subunit epsilon
MLAVMDLETTGSDVKKDRIVQLAFVKIDESFIQRGFLGMNINPTIPIPKESTQIHGLTNDDVKECRTFADAADEVLEFLRGCDIGGFNIIEFDLPLLQVELARCNKVLSLYGRRCIDAKKVFCALEPRNLESACRFYCNTQLKRIHAALNNALAAVAVLEGQKMYYGIPDLNGLYEISRGNNITSDGKFVRNGEGEVCLNFGKLKGHSVQRVLEERPEYFEWMVDHGLFTAEVKDVVRKILKGEFTSRD